MLRRLLFASFGALLVASAAPGRDRDRDRNRDTAQQEQPSSPEADRIRTQADQAYQRGEYPRVIELANILIQSYPNDNAHVAYHLRASAKVEMGRASGSAKLIRDGIGDARQALGIAGARFPWLHIPYLYGLSGLAEMERRPEHAQMAIRVVSPVLQGPMGQEDSAEDRANLLYQRALAYGVLRDYKAAISDWTEAIRLSPAHLGAHVKRAAAYASLGHSKEAVAAFDAAVRQFPNTLLVYNDRGSFRRSVGELDGAVADFTKCLQIDPGFGLGYLNRGMCLADQNSHQAAENDFSTALKHRLDPAQTLLAYRLRGASRLSQGNAAGALADLTAAAKAAPRDAGVAEDRAVALFCQKEFPAAATEFAKARVLNPQLVRLVPWEAVSLARGGQAAEARALLDAHAAEKTPAPIWTRRICEFLRDQIPEAGLIDAAADQNPQTARRQLCEAHFFAGEKKLLGADAGAARTSFKDSVETQQASEPGYRVARFELGTFK